MTSTHILLLPVLILLMKINRGMLIDFCSINKNHILCNPDAKPVQNCGDGNFSVFPNNDEDRAAILHVFNKYRNEIAAGERYMSQGKLPAAADMLQLKYNKLCEKASFNYFRFCRNDKTRSFASPKCCNCLNIGEFRVYAFLLEYGSDLEHLNPSYENLMEFVLDGTKRRSLKLLDVRNNFTFQSLDAESSLILYASRISHVGCAFQRFKVSGTRFGFQLLMCCYIGTFPEDVLNKEIYTQGKGASKCPPNTQPSSKYQNLCECKKGIMCYTKAPPLTSSCGTDKQIVLTSLKPSINTEMETKYNVTQNSVEAVKSNSDRVSVLTPFNLKCWAIFTVLFRIMLILH